VNLDLVDAANGAHSRSHRDLPVGFGNDKIFMQSESPFESIGKSGAEIETTRFRSIIKGRSPVIRYIERNP
jgi:hypothetical protein